MIPLAAAQSDLWYYVFVLFLVGCGSVVGALAGDLPKGEGFPIFVGGGLLAVISALFLWVW